MDINGCVITADAINTQHSTVSAIRNGGADDILPVKKNQGDTFRALAGYFHDIKDFGYRTVSKGHGRMEIREYFVMEDAEWLRNFKEWDGLKSIGYVRKKVTKGEEVTITQRYYISSLPADAEKFERYTRNHWGVEVMHYHLDMIFNEDRCNCIDMKVTENLNIIRKFA